eukprot:CAMPEP_0168750012 /NCGR_PEP_ID=MMETSP0724-20121128/17031_1 /TAXON_ID=265536 /ORGANISM="Amphiprora sp., Strain CCMP467" /LENGTH=453 /DNA_ID=CAMNT_0008797977 /DNA_START=170 /DNA_END=1531 /DNA_ORIENTATION=-
MDSRNADSNDSLGYSDTESYLQHGHGMDDGGSLGTAQNLNHQYDPRGMGRPNGEEHDATSVVHEMHLALLYLLSNPDEFQRALAARPSRGATTLHEWNAEYEDNESLADTAVTDSFSAALDATQNGASSNISTTPLPFVVFADDAEVVLPAAFSASQLFGLEKVSGMELEAAAGLPALSQLFLRWLALMPGGDHLNLIDPPGLTVMRIAGGRYRVTAAHRVVWTWMNEFPDLGIETDAQSGAGYSSSYNHSYDGGDYDSQQSSPHHRASSQSGPQHGSSEDQLKVGDLVSLTIVDVFETDNQGKLLSYCPTFDNRAVTKTNAASETLHKTTTHLVKFIGAAQKSVIARKISFHATKIAMALKEKVEEAVSNNKNLSPLASSSFQMPSISPARTNSSATTTKSPKRREKKNHRAEEKKQDSSTMSPPRRSGIASKELTPPRKPFPTEELESHDV